MWTQSLYLGGLSFLQYEIIKHYLYTFKSMILLFGEATIQFHNYSPLEQSLLIGEQSSFLQILGNILL